MFIRQHYEAIAEIIKSRIEYVSVFTDHTMAKGTCNGIATELADYFAKDNPRFDRDKFLEACGL